MLPEVWAAIDREDWEEARKRLEADPDLLASRAGQMALGYVLAHTGDHAGAREVYGRLRQAHAGDPWEHIAVHQLGMVERLAGEHRAALRLFAQERALIGALPGAERPFKRAVNGYELVVNHLALGEAEQARAALEEALADAHAADDPMTLGCLHRARGELAAHGDDRAGARAAYQEAAAFFREAEDDRAAADAEARAASLDG
ncbi:tetratricopeptide (TPR) repeat protein [Deinococcus sp. HSC-46F16]|uniref:hypothetical protein n=1 Tax=Deinococcus sp. HSC-46F16 TaxID=2910968 RepID=UPI0020A10DD0|nr:hypothetical protein [Deinococcus sp. HSC-46F16]MCP2013259.1 tetratricopeptide (TPR) repeat protein [Deinococcus sp. HSC-46F16]